MIVKLRVIFGKLRFKLHPSPGCFGQRGGGPQWAHCLHWPPATSLVLPHCPRTIPGTCPGRPLHPLHPLQVPSTRSLQQPVSECPGVLARLL